MYKARYYMTASGRYPVKEFIEAQDAKAAEKIISYILYLCDKGPGLHRPYADTVRGKIRELRVEFSPNNYRIFYYFSIEQNIIMLHGIKKKDQKLKQKDIETAEVRMLDFETRIRKGEIKL